MGALIFVVGAWQLDGAGRVLVAGMGLFVFTYAAIASSVITVLMRRRRGR